MNDSACGLIEPDGVNIEACVSGRMRLQKETSFFIEQLFHSMHILPPFADTTREMILQ